MSKTKLIIEKLYTSSTNKARVKDSFTTTPKTDEAKKISEMNICCNFDYDNFFVKTFWDGKNKAYRYNIKHRNLHNWINAMEDIQQYKDEQDDDDELFS